MKNLKWLFTFCLLSYCLLSNKAIAQVSIGGTPPSLQQNLPTGITKQTIDAVPLVDLAVTFDVAALKAEDAENKKYGHPPRLGVTIPANLNLFESGKWESLDNGQRICRLAVRAQGAKALSIYYSHFYIPEGAKLYIYNKEYTNIIGAFTNKNNLSRKAFATEYTAGDEVILEYVAPIDTIEKAKASKISYGDATLPIATRNNVTESPVIIISAVGYGYANNIVITENKPGISQQALNESGSCNVNINCSEGEDWQREKNSVARLIIYKGGGQFYCSGTLIHNTARDFSPYFISAHHCFAEMTPEEMLQTVFYFNYEQAGCISTAKEPEHKTIVGATQLVDIPLTDHSDGALLILNERIPDDWGLFWSGWDRRNDPMKEGVSIHHPTGDAMKISTIPQDVTYSSRWPETKDGPAGGPGAHWQVIFTSTENGHSIVEGGSSGSALFNQDKRLVGTLTGASCSCQYPAEPALYGKLWYHWDQHPDPAKHMAPYLDPINSGEEYIDGQFLTGATSANFSVASNTVYAGEEVPYIDLSYGQVDAWHWEFRGGIPETSTEQNPVVVYSVPGKYSASLTITYTENGTQKQLTRERINVVTVTQKGVHCDAETITVGTGSNISEFPLGSTNVQTYSSSIYNKNNFNRTGVIESLSWNASVASATGRKVRIYMKEVSDSTFATSNTWDNEITGAQLVFESTDDYTIPQAGWVDIPFDTTFTYTGTKHLKILVHTTASAAPYQSAGCYYTNKANTHLQWSTSNTSPIVGNGTISSNLPNIKVGFAGGNCARAPKADFEMLSDPFFKESFDNIEIPQGWAITKPGSGVQKWELGNIIDKPFSTFEPNNLASIIIAPSTIVITIDSWLISKPIILSNNTTSIQFYAGFNAVKTKTLPMIFYISTDNQATWEELWRTPTGNANWNWYKVIKNIRQYAGKQVHFAWRAYGQYGDYMALDQVQIFGNKDKVNIYEGESVDFVDRSSGPPVSWKWTLPGGTLNANSSTSLLQPFYWEEGEYDAKLHVQNNIGVDSMVLNKVINVMARKPVAKIISTGGYTRAENHNRFIPIGASVSYTDTSLNVPRTRQWDFEGGDPSTSNDKKVIVKYDTEGIYSTKLSVSNIKGSSDTLINGYVKVGGTDRIWNMPEGDNGDFLFKFGEEGDGYLVGVCRTKADKFAEFFDTPQAPISLSKLDIRFVIDGKRVNTETIKVSVYSSTPGIGPTPKAPLATKILSIADINTDGYTTIEFENPIIINTRYFVVIEGFNTMKTQLALTTSDLSFYSRNTAYVFHYESWYTMPSYVGGGIGVAINIVPTITYQHLAITSADQYNIAFDDTSSRTITVESNTDWNITTTQPWIQIDKTNMTGNGSFTFHCIPNIDNVDRHGVIILSGNGPTGRIYITQTTGSSIVGLQADLMDDFTSIQLKWGNSLADNTVKSNVVLPTIVSGNKASVAPENIPIIEKAEMSAPEMQTYSAAQSLSWSKPPYVDYISYSTKKHYQIASLFYPEDLVQYHGGELTMFEYYPYSIADFRLLIYQNEVLVLDSILAKPTPATYNRIDITSKGVVIDATKSLRITLDIDAAAYVRAMTMDAGPAIIGRGNLLCNSLDGVWEPFTDFGGRESSGNWMMGAYVKMQDVPTNYYRIYRNGMKIAETDKTSFVDSKVSIADDYCYEVTKVSNATDIESAKSNKACVTVKRILNVIASGLQIDYGTPIPTSEYIVSVYGTWNKTSINVPIISGPIIKVREDITSTSPVGTYPNGVEISDLVIENADLYNIHYQHAPFILAPRSVIVAANDDTKKAYGDPDPDTIPYDVSNMVTGETLTGKLARQAGEDVNTYLLNKGTLNEANNPNYSISLASGARFNVTRRPVTVVPDATRKTYGDPDPAKISYTVQNGLANETLNGILMREAGENAGEYNILQGQVDNARNPNYDITFKTGRKFTIDSREVTITPDALFKAYGTPDPALTFTSTGLLNNEQIEGALARAEGENAGQYAITAGNLTAGANYQLKFNPGTFTIQPAPLFVQADNLNMAAGSLLPTPTYTMSGYKSGDEDGLRSIINNLIYIDADRKPTAGVYNILFGGQFAHKNYNATFAPGKLTVGGSAVTAFVPGSTDSQNATFMPEGATYLKVFSRNGIPVYEGSQPWDGNNKQGRVEAGIYYYVATMADGSSLKGSVEVYKL